MLWVTPQGVHASIRACAIAPALCSLSLLGGGAAAEPNGKELMCNLLAPSLKAA